MKPEQMAQIEALPVRRDMITLLTYLRDHRVSGTQSTGNLPLKAVRQVTAQFVHPPALDETVGEHTYRLRSESDVWPLYFLHILADVGGLMGGGPAQRLQVTLQGKKFLDNLYPVQAWYMLATWWWKVNWLVAYPVIGMGERLPRGFSTVVIEHLLVQTEGQPASYDAFAGQIMQRTGYRWSKPDLPNADDFMRSGIYNIVMRILLRFEAVEVKFRDKIVGTLTFQEPDVFWLTPLGRGLLQAVDGARQAGSSWLR